MIRIAVFCLLFVQVLTHGPPSEKCRKGMHEMRGKKPFECCKIPPVFQEGDLKACGIELPDMNDEETRPKPPDCDKQVCLMKKYNLMKDDSNVDKEAIAAFLDKWGDTNKDFKDAVEAIKTKCLDGEQRGPPDVCETTKMNFCIVAHMFSNCPKWEDTDECAKVKDFVKECTP